ncbi:Major intrinsic protein, partial [Sesbania bispinosa]
EWSDGLIGSKGSGARAPLRWGENNNQRRRLESLERNLIEELVINSESPRLSLQEVGAEFIGTFILIFAGTAIAIVNQKTQASETLIGCADSTGLAVMIVILSTSHIFYANLNPVV